VVLTLPIVDFQLPIGFCRELLIGNRQLAMGNVRTPNLASQKRMI
jgi:hypothetical protein